MLRNGKCYACPFEEINWIYMKIKRIGKKAVASSAMVQAVNRLPLVRWVRDDSGSGSFGVNRFGSVIAILSVIKTNSFLYHGPHIIFATTIFLYNLL